MTPSEVECIVLPHEAEAIAQRVLNGFDGEVLPIEVHAGRVLVTGAYTGEDFSETCALVSEGCERLAHMMRTEIPF